MVVKKGEAMNQELWYTLPNGTRVCRQTRLLPITGENGLVKSVFYSQVDITELKQREAGLLRANKKAEEANHLKDKFIELISNDMRSILSGVTRQLEIEQTADADSMTEFHSKVLQRSIDSNKRLLNMIDRLLDISRLQSGDILPNKQTHELSTLLSYSLAWLFGVAEKKGVELVIDIPAGKTIFVDDILFAQLMQNLVANAIKFCSAGDKVILFIAKGEENIIAIKDTGVGIEEGMTHEFFSPSVKTSAPGTSGGVGSSLSLPLCSNIMKAHGGELKVESKVGKGSIFYCKFPRQKAVVMVVDDETKSRINIITHLRDTGSEVVEASDGNEAVALLSEVTPNLLLTDMDMPNMNGLELLKFIRANKKTKYIPVIIVSASDDVTIKKVAFRYGATDFIAKPISPHDLLSRVNRFIL